MICCKGVVLFVLSTTVFCSCSLFGKKEKEKATVNVSVEGVKWIEMDEAGMGVENGQMSAMVDKIFRMKLRQTGRIKIVDIRPEGRLRLIVSVGKGEKTHRRIDDEGGDQKDSGSEGKKRIEAVFSLSYRGKEGWPLTTAMVVERDKVELVNSRHLIENVVEQLVVLFVKQIDLLHSELFMVRKALMSSDDDLVVLAIRIVGERKDRESVPYLIKLLEKTTGDDPLREDIIGALEKIGDRRSTHALIQAFKDAPPWQEIQIIRALATTGGKEARDFLEVVAGGHELKPTRHVALDALREMDRNQR